MVEVYFEVSNSYRIEFDERGNTNTSYIPTEFTFSNEFKDRFNDIINSKLNTQATISGYAEKTFDGVIVVNIESQLSISDIIALLSEKFRICWEELETNDRSRYCIDLTLVP